MFSIICPILIYIILILKFLTVSFNYILFLYLSFTKHFNSFFSAWLHFLNLICLSYFDQHHSNMPSYIKRIVRGASHLIQCHDLLYASLAIYDILIIHHSCWCLAGFYLWLPMPQLIRHCNIGIHIFYCWTLITKLFEHEKSYFL